MSNVPARTRSIKALNTKPDPALREPAPEFVPKLGPRASLLCQLAHQLADMSRLEHEMDRAEHLLMPYRDRPHPEHPVIAGKGMHAGVYLTWVAKEATRRREVLQWQILDQTPSNILDVLVLLQLATKKLEALDLGEDSTSEDYEKPAVVAALNACINHFTQDGLTSPLGNDNHLVCSEPWSETVAIARRELAKFAADAGEQSQPTAPCSCFECNRAEDGGRQ